MTNQITLTGNMGREAHLAFTQDGKPVLNLSIADTPRRKNQQGEWEDAGETLWADVSVWGEDAEALAEALGSNKVRLTVTGRPGWRTFQKKDGTPGAAFTIRADSVAVHAPRKQQAQGGGFGGQQQGGFTQQPQQQPAADPWASQSQQQGGQQGWATGTNYDEPPF